jgi:Ca2+-dependent lipid-binding protein
VSIRVELRTRKCYIPFVTNDLKCCIRYVVVRVNDVKRHKSKVIKKNAAHPVWNEPIKLVLTSKADSVITFHLYDWNAMSEHKALGYVSLPCSAFVNGEVKDHMLKLQDSSSEAVFHVRTLFQPDHKARFTNKTRIKLDPLNVSKAVIGGIGTAGMLGVKTVGQGITGLRTLGKVEEQLSGTFEDLHTPMEAKDHRSSISRSPTVSAAILPSMSIPASISIAPSVSFQGSLREESLMASKKAV